MTDHTYRMTTPCCIHCGKSSEVELTPAECFALDIDQPIQAALPNRDADFRELVKTGTHADCWDAIFADDEDEEG